MIQSWKNIYRILTVLLIVAFTSFANNKSDFLIIEQARSLIIFNQYQQQASAQEKAELLSFVPFKILNANDVLGDGFTPCVKVEVNGKVLFIEKDENGTLHGVEQAGFQKTFRNATELGDTIQILKNNRLTLADAQQTRASSLEQGARVVRIFNYQSLTYVKLLGSAQRYGWVNFDEAAKGRDWGFAKLLGVSVADQLQKILPHVQLKTKEVNDKLSRLFQHFNQKSSRQLPAPQWELQQSANRIVCALHTNIPPGSFSATSQAFSKGIEGILLGTNLQAVTSPGRIEIRR